MSAPLGVTVYLPDTDHNGHRLTDYFEKAAGYTITDGICTVHWQDAPEVCVSYSPAAWHVIHTGVEK